jgi:phage shock protein A
MIDPEHRGQLRLALSGLPEGGLVAVYKGMVDPRDKLSYLTVGRPLKDLADHHVLENLERIAVRFPKVIEVLASVWLEENQAALRDFGAGKTSSTPPSPDWLKVALWLWENTDHTAPPTWAAVAAWLDQLDQYHRTQQTQLGGVGAEREQLKTNQIKLERQLRNAEARKTELQDENRSLKDELRGKNSEIARLGKDLQSLRQQAGGWQAEANRLMQGLEAKARAVESLEHQYSQLRSQLFERDQELTQQYDQNQRLLERVHQLDAQLELHKQEVGRLEHETARLRRFQGSPVSVDLLERALLIDYPALSTVPAQRLIGLLELYRAFLEGRPHPHLEAHTNLAAHSQESPVGILLLGLEQLLQDGIHLPLERFLKASTFGIEAVLHHLVTHLPSPRLKPEGVE